MKTTQVFERVHGVGLRRTNASRGEGEIAREGLGPPRL